ncbi:MAG: hypothetical protein JSU04_13410 [Bdellovibrionales bacterium]|nr:hypothetical protein [Bdellovibrionales bacterium]
MDLERLQYRGFKPRQEVTDQAEKVSQKLLDESPVAGSARVVISDEGEQFHVSVVGATFDKKLFSSESAFRKQHIRGWPREWQLGALAQVLGDFVRQLRNHFRDDDKKPEV